MQGHNSSVTTLPGNLGFDHGSTSSEPGIDSEISWNSMQTSTHNRIPDYRISSNDTNIQYIHPVGHEGLNVGWSLGETSSTASHSQGENNERKREHTWNIHTRAALTLDEPPYQPSDILPSDDINVNANISHTAASMSSLPRIVEHPNTYITIGLSNEQTLSIGNSSDLPSGSGGYVMDESEHRPDFSLDGRHISCKRKSLEVHVGQSFDSERSYISSMSMHNGPVQANPRLRLGVGGPLLANPFSSTARGAPENSRRNFRLRINGSRQQEHHVTGHPFLPGLDPINADILSSQNSPSLVLRNHLFDLNPPPAVENGSLHGQSCLLHVPSLRRNTQSRRGGASSSRTNSSSISEERDPMLYEETIPRSISEHPLFVPASEIGTLSQQPTNWNLVANNIVGNIVSTSQAGSGSGIINSSGPSRSNRARQQYSRRLSEIIRRSLLSTAGIESSGGQAVRPNSSQGMTISSGSGNHGRHLLSSRSALSERQHVDGAFGLPHSLQSLAGGGEGRTSIMSEHVRHVLDLMRRGEGLRFEDMMILDHSVFFGMADIHDRHRDMRLDVDNMSYEELLALEDRIGNVCTGLNEEIIMGRLKQQKYINTGGAQNQTETEPCSICREEYNDGEDLGTLQCGHGFHRNCIKQWLMHKNLCPICKTTGLTT